MVRPILTHPLESIKYILRSIEPAIAIKILSLEYKRTKDDHLALALAYYFDKWQEIAYEHYSKIGSERTDKLICDLNDLEYKILSDEE